MLLIFILFGLITSRIISKLIRSEEEKQNMIKDLIKINEEIRTLRGIIPICSSCKKIRDDDGYWHQVEIYIRDHSEADFTHGICPDCLSKFYKDFIPN